VRCSSYSAIASGLSLLIGNAASWIKHRIILMPVRGINTHTICSTIRMRGDLRTNNLSLVHSQVSDAACSISPALQGDARAWYKTKGLTQNVMAACTPNLLFTFVLAGWEGSASDSKIYGQMLPDWDMAIPAGRVYLADAGFGASTTVVVPYIDTHDKGVLRG
jgi:hypothetical protein